MNTSGDGSDGARASSCAVVVVLLGRPTILTAMKCPHCTTTIHETWFGPQHLVQVPPDGPIWAVRTLLCPECEKVVIDLHLLSPVNSEVMSVTRIWPSSMTRPVPPEVDEPYVSDYEQAVATLALSPKASAALSRRLVQDIIREKAGITKKNLDSEITEVIGSGQLPSWLSGQIDAIRAVGNFAAHPIKGTNTGEIVDVEPGEAEFLLDVLDSLFDFYFVQPAKSKAHLDGINAKLQDAGKPALKTPTT
jgi:hypothetical protein